MPLQSSVIALAVPVGAQPRGHGEAGQHQYGRCMCVNKSIYCKTTEDIPEIDTFARLGHSPHIQPTIESKVDTLSAVEAEIEAGVIPAGERHDELASMLNQTIRTT